MEEQIESAEEMDNSCAIPTYKSPYNNPYILSRYNDCDLKFTRKKCRQYRIVNWLSEFKLFQKETGIFSNWLKKYKKKIHYDFLNFEIDQKYQISSFKPSDAIDVPIDFKYLYIYDLMPRENLEDLRIGLKNLLQICDFIPGGADEISINRQFDSLTTTSHIFSRHSLGYYKLKATCPTKWIDNIYISLEEYGESYCFVVYRLELYSVTNEEIYKILNSALLSNPIFIKQQRRDQIVSNCGSFLIYARQEALENLILEIEYDFFNNINLPTFFHKNHIPAPTLAVYLVENELDAKRIRPIIDFFNDSYDRTKKNGISFSSSHIFNKSIKNCIINKEIVTDYEYLAQNFDSYMANLAKLQIVTVMNRIASKVIAENQKKLNKLLSKKTRIRKLLNGKKKSITSLFWIERFIDDVVERNSEFSTDYEDNLTNNGLIDFANGHYQNSYQFHMEILNNSFKDHKKRIESIYSIYDGLLKTIESSTNLLLVRSTLIVSAFAALASIIALFLNEQVMDFFNNLFS